MPTDLSPHLLELQNCLRATQLNSDWLITPHSRLLQADWLILDNDSDKIDLHIRMPMSV